MLDHVLGNNGRLEERVNVSALLGTYSRKVFFSTRLNSITSSVLARFSFQGFFGVWVCTGFRVRTVRGYSDPRDKGSLRTCFLPWTSNIFKRGT